MSLKQFFTRAVGQWESHRTYMYKNGKCTYSTTLFEWRYDAINNLYLVDWNNIVLNSTGTMSINIVSDFKLLRSNGYFTNQPTESTVMLSSKNYLKTLTSYGGCTYDEEITFINDNRRIRRTTATKDNTKDVILIGTYVERRV